MASAGFFKHPIQAESLTLVKPGQIDDRATLTAEGIVLTADVQLADAAIQLLANTPQALIAAPGAGRAILVHSLYIYLARPTNSYDDAASDGNFNLKYADGSNGSAGLTFEADAFIDAGTSTGRFFAGSYDYVAGAALVITPVANKAVQLDNNGAEFTSAADTTANTLSMRIRYTVIDVAAFS